MTAAAELLDQGATMAELSVDRLTQHAGVSRSSFYMYFEDRTDLLRSWFASVVDEIVAPTSVWWALGPRPERVQVRTALGGIVSTYRPHARLMAATFDAATHDAALRELTNALIEGSIADLRKHIRHGQRTGWIDSSLHAESCAAQLTWMAERIFHRLLPGAGETAVEHIVDSYTDIVFNTLYRAAD